MQTWKFDTKKKGNLTLTAALKAIYQSTMATGQTTQLTDLQIKTSRTLHTPEALRESIKEIRRQGWVIIDQELEVGLRSLAVPLKDSAGQVLAALNVGTHAGRVSRQELETRFLPVLLEASRELSTRLFH